MYKIRLIDLSFGSVTIINNDVDGNHANFKSANEKASIYNERLKDAIFTLTELLPEKLLSKANLSAEYSSYYFQAYDEFFDNITYEDMTDYYLEDDEENYRNPLLEPDEDNDEDDFDFLDDEIEKPIHTHKEHQQNFFDDRIEFYDEPSPMHHEPNDKLHFKNKPQPGIHEPKQLNIADLAEHDELKSQVLDALKNTEEIDID